METIIENNKEYVLVSNDSDLKELINQISKKRSFATLLKFSDREFFITLLDSLKISEDDFKINYFYYDPDRKLHISESEFGDVWISTHGLVARKKTITNSAFNAFVNQHTVISLLINKAIETVKDEKVFDIDSRSFEQLSDLSPAIFHNLTFYIEVFCKAYLSISGIVPQHTHKLKLLYQQTVDTMIREKHDDSLFQILILDPLFQIVDHVSRIPGNFKEHFIKYDANPEDDTVIVFELPGLFEMVSKLELSFDFITDYYYIGKESHYLRTDLYQKLLDRAKTEENKKRIQELYPDLAKKHNLK